MFYFVVTLAATQQYMTTFFYKEYQYGDKNVSDKKT